MRGAFDGEPRWVDATWTAEQAKLQRRDGRFLDLLAEIAAPVQGTTKDTIVGDELRQHRRTVRTAVGAAAMLLVLTIAAVIGAFVALDQRDKAESRRQEALSQSLGSQAAEVSGRRPDLGILLGVEAWRHAHTTQAEQALITGAKLEGLLPRVISRGKPAIAIGYQSPDKTFVLLRADGSIERWAEAGDTGLSATGLRDPRFKALLQLGPRTFGLSRDGTVYDIDDSLRDVTGHWSVSSGPRWSAMGADTSGAVLAVGDQGGQLRLWSVADHTPIGPAVLAHVGGVNAVAVRSDGQRVVSVGGGDLQVKTWAVTPTGLQLLATSPVTATGSSVAYLADNATIVVGEWNGAVQVLDADTLAPAPTSVPTARSKLHSAPVTQILPMADGGFTSVGLDGWVKRLTAGFAVFSTRRAAEATPLAAAVDPATGVTAIASADGTISAVDPDTAFEQRVRCDAHQLGHAGAVR